MCDALDGSRDQPRTFLNLERYATRILSVDVEEWFHILHSPATPNVYQWDELEPRLPGNVEMLLTFLDEAGAHATFFWLGWAAEKYPKLLRRCRDAGHEIGCHGYGHLPYARVGPEVFREDITRGRAVLQEVLGESVRCFRTPGFVVDGGRDWFFDVVAEAGYTCDSSTLDDGAASLSRRGRSTGTYVIKTNSGPLVEVPVSAMMMGGRRLWSFGGGYLRLMPAVLLDRVAERTARTGRPLVVYLHPRDVDRQSPCLRLGLWGRFKFVVNRKTTFAKLRRLQNRSRFCSIREFLTFRSMLESANAESRPIVRRDVAIQVTDVARPHEREGTGQRTGYPDTSRVHRTRRGVHAE